jgi:hypothetical protein
MVRGTLCPPHPTRHMRRPACIGFASIGPLARSPDAVAVSIEIVISYVDDAQHTVIASGNVAFEGRAHCWRSPRAQFRTLHCAKTDCPSAQSLPQRFDRVVKARIITPGAVVPGSTRARLRRSRARGCNRASIPESCCSPCLGEPARRSDHSFPQTSGRGADK